MKYMRVCPICGITFETNDNELITCTSCKNCKNSKKKNTALISYVKE